MVCAEPRSASTNRKPYSTLQRQIYDTFGEVQKILNKMTSHNFEKTYFLANYQSTLNYPSQLQNHYTYCCFCISPMQIFYWFNPFTKCSWCVFINFIHYTICKKLGKICIFWIFTKINTFVVWCAKKKLLKFIGFLCI